MEWFLGQEVLTEVGKILDEGSISFNYGGIFLFLQYIFINQKNEETPSHVIHASALLVFCNG